MVVLVGSSPVKVFSSTGSRQSRLSRSAPLDRRSVHSRKLAYNCRPSESLVRECSSASSNALEIVGMIHRAGYCSREHLWVTGRNQQPRIVAFDDVDNSSCG